METQDRPQDWRIFSLSHRMGEGRGEGASKPEQDHDPARDLTLDLVLTLTLGHGRLSHVRTLQNHDSLEVASALLIANWKMRSHIREQTS
jgi:hypothetical protein